MNVLEPATFRFPAGLVPGARRVAVVGPFNGWDHGVHRMSRRAGGDWTVTIYLPPGRVLYLFDVAAAGIDSPGGPPKTRVALIPPNPKNC